MICQNVILVSFLWPFIFSFACKLMCLDLITIQLYGSETFVANFYISFLPDERNLNRKNLEWKAKAFYTYVAKTHYWLVTLARVLCPWTAFKAIYGAQKIIKFGYLFNDGNYASLFICFYLLHLLIQG